MDFDASGLIAWAKSRFGVEISESELHGGGTGDRRSVADRLHAAACEKINSTNLDGLEQYLQPGYGVRQLVDWAKNKLTIDLTPEEIETAKKDPALPPTALIMKKAEDLYLKREIQYAVEMTMDIAMLMARQGSPSEATAFIANWANQRFNGGLTPQSVMQIGPPPTRSGFSWS